MTVSEKVDKKEEEKNDNMEVVEEVETEEQKKLRTKREAFKLLVADVVNDCNIVQRGVLQGDDRLIGRALRQAFHTRKKFTSQLLNNCIQKVLSNQQDETRKNILLGYLSTVKEENQMDIEENLDQSSTTNQVANDVQEDNMKESQNEKQTKKVAYPVEVDVFLQLLVIAFLIDKKNIEEAVKCSSDLIQYIDQFNRRTLNLLASKVYFYYSRSFELNGKLSSIRPVLLSALRTASLRHDNHCQAMIINLLLRNYLADNLYDQASMLITKTPTVDIRSTSQLARFFYYKGRIKSVQLDYSDAYNCLMTAIRKAPTTSARGFRLAATKLAIIVKLLMGEIPERSIFVQPGLSTALKPYFELTKQVRIGDLSQFKEVVDKNSSIYKKDKTYTLVQRIRQNVIRTGLKKISLSYSKIYFKDICNKLHLDNADDVEFIVAKAIRDGIIDATIDHEKGYIQSKETIDLYSTSEPTEAFHKKIAFCLKIHDECVKSLRFPPEYERKAKKELESAEERIKRQEELAEELAEEDEDDEF